MSFTVAKYEGNPLSNLFYSVQRSIDMSLYRLRTRAVALYSLATLSDDDVKDFMDSYELFNREWAERNGISESHIVNYYKVLNHLCALGNVEKMYIPPLMRADASLVDNQMLYEDKMMVDIGLPTDGSSSSSSNNKSTNGKRCLDIGCGRGRVAMHAASATGAHVSGMNLDATQIENARSFSKRIGLDSKTDFVVASLNDPLPYPDEAFDACYEIQAFTYSKDLDALFREIYRVLKPGAKFSMLEWVLLDKYDAKNPEHNDLCMKSMPALGAVTNPHFRDIEGAMKRAGFVVLLSREASEDGPTQAPMINGERKTYGWLRFLAKYLLPKRFMAMLLRIKMHVDALVKGVEEELFTTSYQIVCQKPEKK